MSTPDNLDSKAKEIVDNTINELIGDDSELNNPDSETYKLLQTFKDSLYREATNELAKDSTNEMVTKTKVLESIKTYLDAGNESKDYVESLKVLIDNLLSKNDVEALQDLNESALEQARATVREQEKLLAQPTLGGKKRKSSKKSKKSHRKSKKSKKSRRNSKKYQRK